jgi:hypothetical protein
MQPNVALLSVAILASTALAGEKKPLVIAEQGSFFMGGETKSSKTLNSNLPGPASTSDGDVTINQMYVQYQIPMNAAAHVPVVMVHGCCLSSKTWETTPDGRMGWNEYFVRKNRAVYLADQSSRARSGFDATIINAVKTGTAKPADLPNIFMASHQTSWVLFRFGPKFNEAFPDEQFPVQAAEELYKQMIPDLNAVLPTPNPTFKNMADLAVKLKGAVLMGHSESGFFPEEAALTNPAGVRGIISIEQPCRTDLSSQQLATLAKIPSMVMFGDHLEINSGRATWQTFFEGCQTFVKQLKGAGGDVEMMHLPSMGIKGNSHMLMQDKNNLQLADLIIEWIDKHVEKKGTKK